MSEYTNRLIDETSPYLLQHAHNPVDWYPWGSEALEKARNEDKPILLSVGYSACHWCHVMERESFENEKIAGLMNQNFVSIKVDREERPDIDGIYMQAVQALTHQGGWPMTVFLTPDGRPFYGGTYFPPRDSRGMPGFPRVLLSMAEAYKNQRQQVEEQAQQLADYLQERSTTPLRQPNLGAPAAPSLALLETSSQALLGDFDPENGGFGGAPKFPGTMSLDLLLRIHLHRQKGELGQRSEPSELEAVEISLQKMAQGGIYDQLGGGFHRYSVDAKWLVPHFEKMLYDNALLSRVYLHAYLVTGKPFYRRIVEETLDYVVREMTSPEGGFYSTQDADSEGVEGKFFIWTPDEVRATLSAEDADLFMQFYDVTPQGNFEGQNILHITQDASSFAASKQLSVEALEQRLEPARRSLFALREKRVKPGRDEKILTSWNGLMLKSFAEAARHFGRADYLQVATRNAEFLLTSLHRKDRLLRTFKAGRAHLNGYLEDYMFLADGLLSLYEAGFETRWFGHAQILTDEAIQLFDDSANGGFFDTGSDHEALVSRPKEIMDNATPAGNSVAANVLLRLAAFTGQERYRERAVQYLQSLASIMTRHPSAFGEASGALDFALSPAQEVAVVGAPESPETQALLKVVNARYLPNSVLACAAPEDAGTSEEIPLLADRGYKAGKPTAYVCQNFACQVPVDTAEDLAAQL